MKRFESYLVVAGATLGMCMSAHGDCAYQPTPAPCTEDLSQDGTNYQGSITAYGEQFSILNAYGRTKIVGDQIQIDFIDGSRGWLGSTPSEWTTTCIANGRCWPAEGAAPTAEQIATGINHWEWFKKSPSLLNKTLEIDIDFSEMTDPVCGNLAEIVLVNTQEDQSSNNVWYDPFYCDAPGSGGQKCLEFDLFEGNKYGFAATLHMKGNGTGCSLRAGNVQSNCPCNAQAGNYDGSLPIDDQGQGECGTESAYNNMLNCGDDGTHQLTAPNAYGPGFAAPAIDTDHLFTLIYSFEQDHQTNGLMSFQVSLKQDPIEGDGLNGPGRRVAVGCIGPHNRPERCCPACDDVKPDWGLYADVLSGGLNMYIGTQTASHQQQGEFGPHSPAAFIDARYWGPDHEHSFPHADHYGDNNPCQPNDSVDSQGYFSISNINLSDYTGSNSQDCTGYNNCATVGDINGDGVVDSADLSALHDLLGFELTDVNNSGCIDIDDLLLVIEDWGDGEDCD